MVVVLSSLLPNPHQATSVMGISINLHAFAFLAAQGVGGAASTCVAQDLGAGRPKQAVHNMKVSAGALTKQSYSEKSNGDGFSAVLQVAHSLRQCAHASA